MAGNRGNTTEAGRLLERAISLLEQAPPSGPLAEAYASSALHHAMAGRPEQALAAAGKALALEQLAPKPRTRALEARGWARVTLGDVGGIEDAREAVRVARSLEMPVALAAVLGNLAEYEWLLEGPVAALASYRESWDLAQRHGGLGAGTAYWSEKSAFCLTWVNGMSCSPGHSSCARHWRPREPATPWPRWSPTGRLSCCCGARAQRPGR